MVTDRSPPVNVDIYFDFNNKSLSVLVLLCLKPVSNQKSYFSFCMVFFYLTQKRNHKKVFFYSGQSTKAFPPPLASAQWSKEWLHIKKKTLKKIFFFQWKTPYLPPISEKNFFCGFPQASKNVQSQKRPELPHTVDVNPHSKKQTKYFCLMTQSFGMRY